MIPRARKICACGRPALKSSRRCGRCIEQAAQRGETRPARDHRHILTEAGQDYCRWHPNTEEFDLTPLEASRWTLTAAGRRYRTEESDTA